MKRIIAGILALGALLALGGCGERLEPFDPKAIADEEFFIYFRGQAAHAPYGQHWRAEEEQDGFHINVGYTGDNEEAIVWDSAKEPERAVDIGKVDTPYMRMLLMDAKQAETRRGIHVGSTLEEVIEAYGGDYPVEVYSWRDKAGRDLSGRDFKAYASDILLRLGEGDVKGYLRIEKRVYLQTGEEYYRDSSPKPVIPVGGRARGYTMVIEMKKDVKQEGDPIVTNISWEIEDQVKVAKSKWERAAGEEAVMY